MHDDDEDALPRCEHAFTRTGNPWHAWSALAIARASDVAVPAWVLEYLEDAAWSLTDLAARLQVERRSGSRQRDPGRLGRAVLRALGLSTGRGHITALTSIDRFRTSLIVWRMADHIAQGDKRTIAADEVAGACGVSRSHVLRCWRSRTQCFPETRSPRLARHGSP